MKLRNHTTLRTDDLAAIVRRVATDELRPGQLDAVTIHVVWRRARSTAAATARYLAYERRAVGALAGLRYNQGIVSVSKRGVLKRGSYDAATVALLVAHEMAEMRGRRHVEMRSPRYSFRQKWRSFYPWAAGMPLRQKAPPTKPTPDVVRGKKLAHAQQMIAAWERRQKAGATRLKTWKRRARELERRAAATLTPPTDGGTSP